MPEKKEYRNRIKFVAALFLLSGFAIIFRINYLQFNKEASKLKLMSNQNEWKNVTYTPERGKIFDRNGYMLAGNKTVYEVGVTIKNVKDPNTVALTLSSELGQSYDKIYNLITQPPSGIVYLTLDQHVPAENGERLKKLKEDLEKQTDSSGSLAGVEIAEKIMRSYPDNSLASNIIGFVNLNNSGNYGIEQQYDSLLAGLPVTKLVPLNPNDIAEIPEVPGGVDLILTIDREIQRMVEEELKKALEDTEASSGTIVIMNPRNGEILAMASTPGMDLNNFSQAPELYKTASEYNRAVSSQYEPGSVFKMLTMSAAIDTGLVTKETTYLDTGFYEIGGAYVYNWNQGAWGPQDMVGCFENSLNVCMARLADMMGEKTFYTYMNRFGIGHTTGVDLANEAKGRLKNPEDDDWYKVDLGTNSFGQGVAVSPIQMMTAASAIANDGKMVHPHVVYAMISNNTQNNTPQQTLSTPISAQTAHTVNEMLAEALVRNQSVAKIDGYRIAGKTGTASIPGPDGRYDPNQTNATFIGWGPADDPQFMIYVWMEKPKISDWASYIAAPIFHNVAEKLVVLMNIPPDNVRLQLAGQ